MIKHLSPWQVIKLKGSAVELLEAMLEETSDKTKELAKGIFSTLDKEAALRTLVFFYHCKHDRRVKRAGRNEEAEHGLFRTYHILVHLADYPGISLEQLGQLVVCTSCKIKGISLEQLGQLVVCTSCKIKGKSYEV